MSPMQFATPAALWALLALPIIWWLLRATPPRPTEQAFPPLRILMQLKRSEETPDKTPWWLLLLRLCMAAILIFAVAHPFTRSTTLLSKNAGPFLLVLDDGFTAAPDWQRRQDAVQNILSEAESRVIYFATTSLPEKPEGKSASEIAKLARATIPQALPSDRAKLLPLLQGLNPAPSEIIWLTDKVDAGTGANFASGLNAIAPTQVLELANLNGPLALGHPVLANGEIVTPIYRNVASVDEATLQAIAGDGRILAESKIKFDGANEKQAKLSLPAELRNSLQSLSIKEQRSAATIRLLDDSWRRKTVAIVSGETTASGQPLLEASHYLVTALAAQAEIVTPNSTSELKDALNAGLSMLILSDIGRLPPEDHDAIAAWVNKGGMLLRFSGPKLSAAADDLLPIKLREGDRNLGSSLSWETPQSIRPLSDQGPLAGIAVDPNAVISRQLLAEPDASLPEKTWASLADGTPLITSSKLGNGRIVLFHITANADWSNLPLTGTFAALMQRLAELAPAAGNPSAQGASATTVGDFAPNLLLSGAGDLSSPSRDVKPIPAKDISGAVATPLTPAGLYTRGLETRAVNLRLAAKDLAPLATTVAVSTLKPADTKAYAPLLFLLAAILFILDGLAALFIAGHFSRTSGRIAILLALLFLPEPPRAEAAETPIAALETHIAFVKTGDADIDGASEAGLKGLGRLVLMRSAAVLGEPVGINVESDELVFYPMIYWPVTAEAESLSPTARANVAAYMKNGGTIFFDLRDPAAQIGSGGSGEALRRILTNIDVPPLETIPAGHALTKSFYLMKDFPGRYEGAPLWVETSDDPQASGFDNVSGIIVGANDYASAWASDERGRPLYALVPNSPRQREMALRVGMNVVMYVLTGNYKTDQVHIPAILERLGKP